MIQAPEAARAAYLAKAYREVIEDPKVVAEKLEPLRRLRGHATVDRWVSLSQEGALVDLSHALMVDHYDPSYAKSRRVDEREILAEVFAKTLDEAGQERAADGIAAAVNAF
jgi:tRNA 2-selenouridine synthase